MDFTSLLLFYLLQISNWSLLGHKSLDETLLIEIQNTIYGHTRPEAGLDCFLALDFLTTVYETNAFVVF